MRRNRGLATLLLAVLLEVHGAPFSAARDSKFNVVILDICSARADHFGMYGYSRPTTPMLDRIANESVVFDNAMAQSSWCLPNYASLFTGHVPEVHGRYANELGPSLPKGESTMAQKLKTAGYRTAAFSGGVYLLPAWKLDRGFDVYSNALSSSSAEPASFRRVMPQALNWIEGDRRKPFFLYAAVDDMHAPYQAADPEIYDPGYDGIVHDTDVPNVRFYRAYNGEPLEPGDSLSAKLRVFRGDPRSIRHLTAHYDAALTSVDRQIAEFIGRLKAEGLWDHTVVIITADHGELLGEHELLGHTQGLYEPVLHVPLIVHDPGSGSGHGRRVSELVQRIDLMPTVLDIGGASYGNDELQGKSLLPLLRQASPPWREYAFAGSKRNMAEPMDRNIDERVARDRRWKLHWYMYKNGFELYDLQNDPQEKTDVSASHPDVVARLSFQLLKYVESTRPHAPGLPSGRTGAESADRWDMDRPR